MKTVRGQDALLLLMASALAVTASGCAVGFRSFSIDSTSRTPFMGFELKERKPKSSAPVYNSISRSDDDAVRIEPALRSQSTSANSLLNLSLKNPFSVKSPEASTTSNRKADQQPPSIAIPATVNPGASSPVNRASNTSNLDFQ